MYIDQSSQAPKHYARVSSLKGIPFKLRHAVPSAIQSVKVAQSIIDAVTGAFDLLLIEAAPAIAAEPMLCRPQFSTSGYHLNNRYMGAPYETSGPMMQPPAWNPSGILPQNRPRADIELDLARLSRTLDTHGLTLMDLIEDLLMPTQDLFAEPDDAVKDKYTKVLVEYILSRHYQTPTAWILFTEMGIPSDRMGSTFSQIIERVRPFITRVLVVKHLIGPELSLWACGTISNIQAFVQLLNGPVDCLSNYTSLVRFSGWVSAHDIQVVQVQENSAEWEELRGVCDVLRKVPVLSGSNGMLNTRGEYYWFSDTGEEANITPEQIGEVFGTRAPKE